MAPSVLGLHGGPPSPLSRSPTDPNYLAQDLTGHLVEAERYPFAHGGYASVFKYRAIDDTEAGLFAVKCLNYRGREERFIKKLKREINTWWRLDHPNVHRLLGLLYKEGSPFPCLVSAFMGNGTAKAFFRDKRQARLLHFLLGVANGIKYLHENNVAHGDIRGDNILVTDTDEPRIGDFGLSRVLKFDGEPTATTTYSNGTARWLAIEYLDFNGTPKTSTKEGDVWSFGCTVLELWSGRMPYYDVPAGSVTDAQVLLRLSRGELPVFPEAPLRQDFAYHKERVMSICTICWVKDPRRRLTIEIIATIISSFCSEECHPKSEVSAASVEAVINAEIDDFSRSDTLEIDNSGVDLSEIAHRRSQSRSSSTSTIAPGDVYSQVSASSLSDARLVEDIEKQTGASAEASSPPSSDAPLSSDASSSTSPGLVPWSEKPPPPSPTLESILKYINIPARQALHQHWQGGREVYNLEYRESESIDLNNSPIHTSICLIRGEEYGRCSAKNKKQAREAAALCALKTLYHEDLSQLSSLRFLPLFNKHLRDHSCTTHIERTTLAEPSPDDQQRRVIRVSYKYDGVILADGIGATRDEAEERAACNAAVVWRSSASDEPRN